jgi:hypothetical protein
MADTLGSVGVIISTLLINRYGWTGFDPLASIFIAVLIFASVVPLVVDSGKLLVLDLGEEKEAEVRKALTAVSFSLRRVNLKSSFRLLRLPRSIVSKAYTLSLDRGFGKKIPRPSSVQSASSSHLLLLPFSTIREHRNTLQTLKKLRQGYGKH